MGGIQQAKENEFERRINHATGTLSDTGCRAAKHWARKGTRNEYTQ